MTGDKLFEQLDSTDVLEPNSDALRTFLLEQLGEYERDPSKGEEIAYGIAGLMAAQSIMKLQDGNPYLEALRLAADLELPPHQRDADSTWDRFAAMVKKLPNNN